MLLMDFTIAARGLILFREPDAASLSAAWTAFRDRHDLGASHILSGGTVSRDGVVVGRMSYNGRIWAGEWHPGAEPLFDPAAPSTAPLQLR